MIPVHSPTATRAKLHHLIFVLFFILFLSLEKVEGWSSGAIFVFFTELIAIQGMSKFVQQLDPLLSNLCRDDSRGRGLGDGVSGRG